MVKKESESSVGVCKLMKMARATFDAPRWNEGDSQDPYVELTDQGGTVFACHESDLRRCWEQAEDKLSALYTEKAAAYLVARGVETQLYRNKEGVALFAEGVITGAYRGATVYDAYTAVIYALEKAVEPLCKEVLLELVEGVTRSSVNHALEYRFLATSRLCWSLRVVAQDFIRDWTASTLAEVWQAALSDVREVATLARDRLQKTLDKIPITEQQ